MTDCQINMNIEVILEPQGVEITSLYDLVDRYRRSIAQKGTPLFC